MQPRRRHSRGSQDGRLWLNSSTPLGPPAGKQRGSPPLTEDPAVGVVLTLQDSLLNMGDDSLRHSQGPQLLPAPPGDTGINSKLPGMGLGRIIGHHVAHPVHVLNPTRHRLRVGRVGRHPANKGDGRELEHKRPQVGVGAIQQLLAVASAGLLDPKTHILGVNRDEQAFRGSPRCPDQSSQLRPANCLPARARRGLPTPAGPIPPDHRPGGTTQLWVSRVNRRAVAPRAPEGAPDWGELHTLLNSTAAADEVRLSWQPSV